MTRLSTLPLLAVALTVCLPGQVRAAADEAPAVVAPENLAELIAKAKSPGQKAFLTYCATCHQPNGKGVPGAFPPLAKSPWIKGDPERLIRMILNGLQGEIMVLDKPFNAQMPPQGQIMSDAEIATALTYVRSSWGNKEDAVDEKRVAELRKDASKRAEYWDAEELLALYPLPLPDDWPLRQVNYRFYKGSFKKLPDFDKMEPDAAGHLPGGKLTVDLGHAKDEYGVVLVAKLILPAENDYNFAMASDDGARLFVDGNLLIENDGIHPADHLLERRIVLPAGEHDLRVEYFEYKGHEQLFVGLKGKDIGRVDLTDWVFNVGKAKQVYPPIPLTATDGEAVIYRNFIEGANPRGIGVGYPGGVNQCWDADILNVAMIWRGDFMDASRHWNGRGQGFQPPMGDHVLKPAEGYPLAVLESNDTPWPAVKMAKLETAKDGAKATYEYLERDSAYRFKGYQLKGSERIPEFRYTYGDLEVFDRLEPAGGTTPGLSRALSIQGTKAPGDGILYLRAAAGESIQPVEGGFQVGKSFKVVADWPMALIRSVGKDRQELLVPISLAEGGAKLEFAYQWTD